MADFAVSIWDSMFGETLTTESRPMDGQILRRTVTAKWFWKMVALGQLTDGPAHVEARILVAKARLTASEASIALMDEHGFLVDIDDDEWMFYVVVGILTAGSMLCAKRFPDYEHIARTVLIDTEAEKWDPRVGTASQRLCEILSEAGGWTAKLLPW